MKWSIDFCHDCKGEFMSTFFDDMRVFTLIQSRIFKKKYIMTCCVRENRYVY